MPTFSDAKGNTWGVNLTLALCDKIQAKHGLDFLAIDDLGQAIQPILIDRRKLFDVLVTICEPADVAGFAEGFDARTLRDSFAAIQEAIADFSQTPELAKVLRELFAALGRKLRAVTSDEFAMNSAD